MGHSDITVTLDTYTHLGLEDAAEELKRLAEVEQARKEQENWNADFLGVRGLSLWKKLLGYGKILERWQAAVIVG